MVAMGGGSAAVLLLLVASVLAPGAMSVKFVFTNNCREVIYPGVLTPAGGQPFPTTGFELQPGASADYAGVPDNWSGNVWARRFCSTDAACRFSNVDGFNMPVQVAPFDVPGTGGCETVACTAEADINASCPPELAAKDAGGEVVGCKSGCLAFGRDDL
ncbi:hypothetical protein E2562_004136 [Oryza meyeriana var. granulata]|uniref:Thaumatin-like protein n=1 Tax=Oryza meyeriana var. granulata TaxID=110450 RepID=A0A6G1EV59_9ORYZ|nr:hypothetical protein E2562_004136 [Oryza meyeriana var. granulata]